MYKCWYYLSDIHNYPNLKILLTSEFKRLIVEMILSECEGECANKTMELQLMESRQLIIIFMESIVILMLLQMSYDGSTQSVKRFNSITWLVVFNWRAIHTNATTR